MRILVPVPTDRDRVEAFIADRARKLPGRPVKLRPEATKIRAALIKHAPDAWNAILDDLADEFIMGRLRHILAQARHDATKARRSSVFAALVDETAEAIRSGDPLPSPFDVRYPTKGNAWKRLGDFNRIELRIFANRQARLSRTTAIDAIYLNALADQLPDDTTTVDESAITEDELLALHQKATEANLGDVPDPDTGE